MLFGIGVDIVEISRFERIKQRFGDRFANRLLTEQEFLQYQRRNYSMNFLATRFAAKEAASKALGTGIAKGISFKSIEVVNDEQGKPQLKFHGVASEFLKQYNIQQNMLSLSDEKHYAVAMVVMESG
jgi:holo-[acyl-carrier protein] synthase